MTSLRLQIFKFSAIAIFIIGNLIYLGGCDGDSDSAAEVDLDCQELECEDQNKAIVEQIYNEVINEHFFSLLDDIYSERVTSNTDNADGLSDVIAFYTNLVAENPQSLATIKHIVGDGEFVAVHWHFSSTPLNEKSGQALIDLFRMEDGIVIEYWSTAMEADSETESGNSLFSDLYDYIDTQPNRSRDIEEENKTIVTEFYLEIFNNYNLEIFDLLVDSNYIQHNQNFPTGSEPLRRAVENQWVGPIDIFLSLAEDDLVWTFTLTDEGQLDIFDLWRFDNNINKIVEHWDVF